MSQQKWFVVENTWGATKRRIFAITSLTAFGPILGSCRMLLAYKIKGKEACI